MPLRETLVVKFCRRYNKLVHEAVAKAQHAPKLYACRQLGGWEIVVMQRLTNPWRQLRSTDTALVPLVVDAYKKDFGDDDSARLVHRDTRMLNVFVLDSATATAEAADTSQNEL